MLQNGRAAEKGSARMARRRIAFAEAAPQRLHLMPQVIELGQKLVAIPKMSLMRPLSLRSRHRLDPHGRLAVVPPLRAAGIDFIEQVFYVERLAQHAPCAIELVGVAKRCFRRGCYHDRSPDHRRERSFHLPQNVEAGHIRQQKVEQDDIKRRRPEVLESGAAVVGHGEGVTGAMQDGL
jgi:hypothetical protein